MRIAWVRTLQLCLTDSFYAFKNKQNFCLAIKISPCSRIMEIFRRLNYFFLSLFFIFEEKQKLVQYSAWPESPRFVRIQFLNCHVVFQFNSKASNFSPLVGSTFLSFINDCFNSVKKLSKLWYLNFFKNEEEKLYTMR